LAEETEKHHLRDAFAIQLDDASSQGRQAGASADRVEGVVFHYACKILTPIRSTSVLPQKKVRKLPDRPQTFGYNARDLDGINGMNEIGACPKGSLRKAES
jgi:hypothetical protein